MRSLFVLVIFFSCIYFSNAQLITKGFRHNRGYNVDFIFKSLNEITNGKSLGGSVGFTELKVYYVDTTAGGAPGSSLGWEIVARLNAHFIPEISATSIPAGTLAINASVDGLDQTPVVLSLADQTIATGNNKDGTWQTVLITYDCAKPAGLLGYDADYYYSDLIIEIRARY